MKQEEIKKIFFKNLKIKVQLIRKLGKGASNVNYLVKTNEGKYVFRINANPRRPEKSEKEFNSLKKIKKLGICPKPVFLGKDFIILNYIEGKDIIGKKLNSRFLKELARLVAKIHSQKTEDLPDETTQLNNSELAEWLKYLNKNLKNKKLLKIIQESKKQLQEKHKNLNKFPKIRVIAHGDICEQNILETQKGLALIDFEDLGLKDPADEIAKIFVDFKEPFTNKQKSIFLKEYLKFRKDNTIIQRIELYEPIIIFMVFVWSIDYVLRIKNREMHKSYLNKKELRKGLEYSDIMFKRAIKFGVIDKRYSNLKVNKELF